MATSIIQLKRGTAARWIELNLVLAAGEPGFESDTKKMKVGDGTTAWRDLPYIGSDEVCSVETTSELPAVGDSNRIYKINSEKSLYQWNATDGKYETLSSGSSFNPSDINLINGGNANG